MSRKDLMKSFMNFQMWMLKHMNQVYLWMVIAGALSYGIITYCASHRIGYFMQLCYVLFMYYASFKLIIR